MDVAHIIRNASANTALAAPSGFSPKPDIITPHYKLSADRFFALVQAVAMRQPRTYQAAVYTDQRQVHYVVRSALFNFPDLVMVQVRPEAQDTSDLILYSRSVYGRGDLGVNRQRVETWLGAIDKKLPPSSER